MKLLTMIENVDPTDTEAMDEIDAHFWHWYRGDEYRVKPNIRYEGRENVSTSRDALKAIRPEGWLVVDVEQYPSEWRFVLDRDEDCRKTKKHTCQQKN